MELKAKLKREIYGYRAGTPVTVVGFTPGIPSLLEGAGAICLVEKEGVTEFEEFPITNLYVDGQHKRTGQSGL